MPRYPVPVWLPIHWRRHADSQTKGCVAATRSDGDVTAAPKRLRVLCPESCLHPHNPALRPCRFAHKPDSPGLGKDGKTII
jgi:hypothetical protein